MSAGIKEETRKKLRRHEEKRDYEGGERNGWRCYTIVDGEPAVESREEKQERRQPMMGSPINPFSLPSRQEEKKKIRLGKGIWAGWAILGFGILLPARSLIWAPAFFFLSFFQGAHGHVGKGIYPRPYLFLSWPVSREDSWHDSITQPTSFLSLFPMSGCVDSRNY